MTTTLDQAQALRRQLQIRTPGIRVRAIGGRAVITEEAMPWRKRPDVQGRGMGGVSWSSSIGSAEAGSVTLFPAEYGD